MSQKLKVAPCTKCGYDKYDLKTTYEEGRGLVTNKIVFISMSSTCQLCGWMWYINPLDK